MIVRPTTYRHWRQSISQLIPCEKTSNQSNIELAAVENGRPKSGTTIFEIMSAGIVTQIYYAQKITLSLVWVGAGNPRKGLPAGDSSLSDQGADDVGGLKTDYCSTGHDCVTDQWS